MCVYLALWPFSHSRQHFQCFAAKTKKKMKKIIERHLCSPPAARILSFLMLISSFFHTYFPLYFFFSSLLVVVLASRDALFPRCITFFLSAITLYSLPTTIRLYPVYCVCVRNFYCDSDNLSITQSEAVAANEPTEPNCHNTHCVCALNILQFIWAGAPRSFRHTALAHTQICARAVEPDRLHRIRFAFQF